MPRRYPRGQLAGPLEYLSLISAIECLPEFYQPLLSPCRAFCPRQPLSLSQDSPTGELPRTKHEEAWRVLVEVKTVAGQTFQSSSSRLAEG